MVARDIVAVFRLRREHRDDVLQGCRADIEVDAVAAQRIHEAADFGAEPDPVEMADADDSGLAGPLGGRVYFVFTSAAPSARSLEVSVRRDTSATVMFARIRSPRGGVADIDAVGIVDGLVEEIQLGPEIGEGLGLHHLVEGFVPDRPL